MLPTLQEKNVFTDVIKLRTLRCKDHHRLSRWALNVIICILIKDLTTHRRKSNITTEQRYKDADLKEWNEVARSQGMLITTRS